MTVTAEALAYRVKEFRAFHGVFAPMVFLVLFQDTFRHIIRGSNLRAGTAVRAAVAIACRIFPAVIDGKHHPFLIFAHDHPQ